MKKIIAFLFAVMVVFILAGCSTQAAQSEKEKQNGNGEGNTSENSELSKDVVYRAFGEGDGRITLDSITFKEDGTFVYHIKGFVKLSLRKQCIADGEDWHKYEYDDDFYWGSYTGDASKDGEIILTIEKERDDDDKIVDYNKDAAVIKTSVSNLRFNIEGTEYVCCGKYAVNPIYEHNDEDEILRLTFRPDGIVEVEDFYGDKCYKSEMYYIGKADEDGILSFVEYDENNNYDEVSIVQWIIQNNILYDCTILENGTAKIDFSFPFNKVN